LSSRARIRVRIRISVWLVSGYAHVFVLHSVATVIQCHLRLCSSVVNGDEHEYQLMEDLLRGYDPRIRPSINSTHPLNVTFGLALAQIIDVVSTAVLL